MLLQLLLGLYPVYYAQIRSNILAQDPLPSLNKAYQQVLQEELVRGFDRVKDKPPNAVGFAVRTGAGRGRGSLDRSPSEKPVCTHCKKPTHLASNCYAFQVCTHCKRRAHDVIHCFEIVGYPKVWTRDDHGSKPHTLGQGRGVVCANAAACNSSSSAHPAAPSTSTTFSSSNDQVFSPEQWKAIMDFFW